MENKFNWTRLVVSIIMGIIAGLVMAPFVYMENPWWHFYVRFALACLLFIAFGVLRLYNALVQNTRFLIKVKNAADKLLTQFSALERSFTNLTNATRALKSAMESREHKTTRQNEQ